MGSHDKPYIHQYQFQVGFKVLGFASTQLSNSFIFVSFLWGGNAIIGTTLSQVDTCFEALKAVIRRVRNVSIVLEVRILRERSMDYSGGRW